MATALHSTQAKLVLAVLVVITAVDLSDGPLLQRSIKTGLSIHTTQYHSSWHMAKIITDGWTGSIDHASTAGLYHSGDLAWMARNWYLNESLIGGDCGGVCNGSLSAAGIDVNCSSTTRNLDITAPKSVNASIFDVSFNRTQDSNGHATLEMTYLYMYSIDEHCNGTISIETCSIRTAVVSYDVTQTASVVRLARRSYPSAMSIIPSSGDLPGPDGRPTGALAALESIGTRYLQSNATLTGFYDGAYGIEPYGALELVYTEPSPGSSANSTCMLLYKNATDDLLWRLHDIMFRMAWDASIGNETAQTPIWTRDVRALSYDAEFATLWVAAGLMLLSITIATSLFWGYWQLEHPVSLSPLETGRALASILEEPAGERDMGVEELLNLIGQRKRD
ncbi:hypothetical protein CC86DRAFT_332059 [Ophiobolus disseminans]|uniref:Transmembrane protein n=1 Tax=Ophiobolus disseminans TaxID=1469910 RepID=A0A6A6ZKR7_9PLEO|nr:hypothetical protein CC86DRAFT_332059 [Ophiobolus disseminans]